MLCAAPVYALEWHALGARAVGMGGAGVASTKGPLAAYWNPAALGRPSQNGLAIPLGVHAAITGSVIEGANNLQKLNDTCASGGTCSQADITNALDKFDEPGSGLRVDGGFGADLKIGRIAFFLNGFTHIGAVPQMDPNSTPANIQSGTNNSKLIVKGANIAELGAAYGRELPFAPGLYLGGALKLLNAQVGYADYFVLRNDNSQGDIIDKLKDGAAKSSSFGVDAGALWDLDRSFGGLPLKPRLGIVARNLNNPKFDYPAAARAAGLRGHFTVNPQVRMGASITPLSWWNLAADVDLTRNLTPVDNAASRQVGLGSEFNVFNRSWLNIPLRVGLMRNTAETSAGNALTLGAGLNFLHVTLEASAAVSGKRVTTESQGEQKKMPREVALGFQLSFLFGGAEEEPAAPKREWKSAPPPDDQPASTETIRKAADKAQEDLKVEELQRTPAVQP